MHCGVIMCGIVVKQDKTLRIAVLRNPRRFQPGAVAPSSLGRVLFGRKLRVVDQNVAIRSVFPQAPIELRASMFKIAGVSNHHATCFDAKSSSSLGMIHGKWVHRSVGKPEPMLCQAGKTPLCR